MRYETLSLYMCIHIYIYNTRTHIHTHTHVYIYIIYMRYPLALMQFSKFKRYGKLIKHEVRDAISTYLYLFMFVYTHTNIFI